MNQELLLRNEYLAAENRILRAKLPLRLRLSDPERATLAEIGKRLGRKALRAVACVAQPDTVLAWYRRLVAKKFDGSNSGSIRADLRLVRKWKLWWSDQFGHRLSDQTVGNILRRHGIAPAPKRSQTTSWKGFITAHKDVLAGADFFTVEVLSWRVW